MDTISEIIPGIYQVKLPLKDNPLGYVNTYLIQGTRGWTLIDTGWNDHESFEAFSNALEVLDLTFSEIQMIIPTHIHPDHFGLAGKIKGLSGAELALHEVDKFIIDSSDMWTGNILNEMQEWLRINGVPDDHHPENEDISMDAINLFAKAIPDRGLKHDDIVSTGVFDLQVIWTPGHSPGHICLYEPTTKILFSGDHILPGITPNISIHAESHGNPLGDYLDSLKLLEGLNMELGLPAHEETYTDLHGRIEQLFAHHKSRKQEILGTIQNESKTAFQISSRITWMEGEMTWDELGPLDRRIAVTETLAHLEALKMENRVSKVKKENITFYEAF